VLGRTGHESGPVIGRTSVVRRGSRVRQREKRRQVQRQGVGIFTREGLQPRVNEYPTLLGRHEVVDRTVGLYSRLLTSTELITNHHQLDAIIEVPTSVVEETGEVSEASNNVREEEQGDESEYDEDPEDTFCRIA